MGHMMFDLTKIDPDKPVLIYGPTASGKSGLALQIAEAQGGVIVNADALQIYQGWPILTAQPPSEDLARAPHHLYNLLPYDAPYSVGDWLRDVTPFLKGTRPIIVGGTGLYFTALTEGLADIPATPPDVRAKADAIPLPDLIAGLDANTAGALDLNNRARVQRAWEVQQTTGRSIRDWQADTPPALLPLEDCTALALMPDVDWLNARIEQRFGMMMDAGALAEAKAMLPNWDPLAPSSKAIGAQELIQLLNNEITTDSAREAIIVATRRYAKRQRTWLRSRMKRWQIVPLPDVAQ
ncbi:tRNA (adenosine(37)-N6)-dimethylallyltransferase MiaA [Octadecabacter sp. CECT 8868]|uniref:tRNA (adenosine(37)-N6)-dimethylallyltransferase MiaA n=1 Tax=Octadecabacter algicola TaxID=2909342 RepID=UPI001EED587B|nr:tRNA (adenosine(37)-N6)-dimethylallyltransferase MiaA [Octadecabacter algicola]MCF2904060.1 tRNA (adenosine(37)-N6)-dimethylallyltransferase MiaA [Octadecabacter algicola]